MINLIIRLYLIYIYINNPITSGDISFVKSGCKIGQCVCVCVECTHKGYLLSVCVLSILTNSGAFTVRNVSLSVPTDLSR